MYQILKTCPTHKKIYKALADFQKFELSALLRGVRNSDDNYKEMGKLDIYHDKRELMCQFWRGESWPGLHLLPENVVVYCKKSEFCLSLTSHVD